MKILNIFPRYRRGPKSRAAAIVEFAVLAPVLITILFGILEYGYMFFVRQTLVNAAREGCRMAVLQSATSPYSEANGRIAEIMSPTGIAPDEYEIVIEDTDDQGEAIENILVTVSVDINTVSLTGFFPHPSGNLEGHCEMRKEGI